MQDMVPLSVAREISEPVSRGLSPRKLPFWLQALTVMVLAAALFFLGLGERALWGPEGRWGSIAREMELSGNYFWPTINGRAYYDKPLLSYWFVIAASRLTDGVNEAAARLPSAAAGLAGVVLLVILANRLYDRRTAVFAGLILGASFGYVFWARVASADMETVMGTLAAITLFVFRSEKKGQWWVVGLWLIMAVTSLTKGLLGFALPLIVIGSYSLLSEGWREFLKGLFRGPLTGRISYLLDRLRWFFNWRTLLAVMLAGMVYYVPFAISQWLMGSSVGMDKVIRENIVRFFEPFDHRGPIYLYTYSIFELAAPWSIFLPAALLQMHLKSDGKSDRFTLTYFWAVFLFFTLSGSRRNYYLLPILPAVAILMARFFTTPKEALNRVARILMNLGFIVVALGMLSTGILVFLPPTMRFGILRSLPELPEMKVFAVLWPVQMAAFIFAFFKLSPLRIGLSMGIVAYLSLVFGFVFVLPETEVYRGEKPFAQAVRTQLNGDWSRLVFYKTMGESPAFWEGFIFYLGAKEPITVYHDLQSLSLRLKSRPDSWIVTEEKDLPPRQLLGPVAERQAEFEKEHSFKKKRGLLLFRPQAGSP